MGQSDDFAAALRRDLEASYAGGAMLYADYLVQHPNATAQEVVEMLLDGRLTFGCEGSRVSIHDVAVGRTERAWRG